MLLNVSNVLLQLVVEQTVLKLSQTAQHPFGHVSSHSAVVVPALQSAAKNHFLARLGTGCVAGSMSSKQYSALFELADSLEIAYLFACRALTYCNTSHEVHFIQSAVIAFRLKLSKQKQPGRWSK